MVGELKVTIPANYRLLECLVETDCELRAANVQRERHGFLSQRLPSVLKQVLSRSLTPAISPRQE
jgi:hypothetical protein